jgi:fucose 4-O-acetylase-like acetyltransferase
VLYHVVGPDPESGLRIADGPLRLLNDGLAYLRMPLFTVLSGVVYGLRPFKPGGDSRAFLLGKARRLLLPMLVVGTVFAVAQTAVPGTNRDFTDWHLMHIYPVAHFWFLEALFLIFLLVWLLDRGGHLERPRTYLLAFAAAAVVHLTVPGTRLLGVEGALYLLPYFLGGLAVTRFGLWQSLQQPVLKFAVVAIAVFAVVQMGLPEPHPPRRTMWMLTAGLALCALCLAIRPSSFLLARIGVASYAIYLFHPFFTAGTRIALENAGVAVSALQLGLALLLGIVGPMLAERLASERRWTALLLLGRSKPQ